MNTNKINNTLITSYTNPDLDGTACAFAYAELLKKQGVNCVAALFGEPQREAKFVLNKFKITINNADKIKEAWKNVILVDMSDRDSLSSRIKPQQVIEVIDHRKVNEASTFPKARIQIEQVGSAATLIAEKFFEKEITMSKKTSILLLSAIVSNTVNFKANVTTDRDRKIANRIKEKLEFSNDEFLNYITEMFKFKSNIKYPLKETFISDFKTFHFNKYNLGIAQLEMFGVDNFITSNLVEIKKSLSELKREKSLNIIFLSCLDIGEGFNKFIIVDQLSEEKISVVLGVKFIKGIAKKEDMIMRKEIASILKQKLI